MLSLQLLRCRINVLDSDVLPHGKSPLAPDTLVYLCKRYHIISCSEQSSSLFWVYKKLYELNHSPKTVILEEKKVSYMNIITKYVSHYFGFHFKSKQKIGDHI